MLFRSLVATRLNPLPDLGPQAVLQRSANEDMRVDRLMLSEAAPAPASAEERLVDDLFGVAP